MSDVGDRELNLFITNVCKPPENFDLPETGKSFSLFGLRISMGLLLFLRGCILLPALRFAEHKNMGCSSYEHDQKTKNHIEHDQQW